MGRQGANVEIYCDGKIETSREGPYGEQAHILQEFHPLPDFDGRFPLIGCWLIASKAVGMGIREDKTLITGTEANFVPHVIVE